MTFLDKFKNDCVELDPDIVVQKYLIEGHAYFFTEIRKSLDEEFIFKKEIANSLKLHIRDIVIVGSGKLGFSIKPDFNTPSRYLYKEFDEFNSDIDVAIVSGDLFDMHLFELFKFSNSYRDKIFGNNFTSYMKYLLKGWLRPDQMPGNYQISTEINLVISKLKERYEIKAINFGIYKSWQYFEQYHIDNIKTIKTNLEYVT